MEAAATTAKAVGYSALCPKTSTDKAMIAMADKPAIAGM